MRSLRRASSTRNCKVALAAVFVAVLLAAPRAWALKFTERRNAEGQTVLLIYDCGRLKGESSASCQPYETMFAGPSRRRYGDPDSYDYSGDAAVAEPYLSSGKYAQVWLYSGGGNLSEGIKLGELFRRYGQYVAVPSGAYCISACTVAFLGGLIREVDAEASYEVHAYSALLSVPGKALEEFRGPQGSEALAEFVGDREPSSRDMAARLFLYAQQMLNGRPNPSAVSAVLSNTSRFTPAYLNSAAHDNDLARIKSDGVPAVQEILMRLERESFEWYLGALRSREQELGARSERAIKVLDIMFSSRIAGTAKLDQNTLRENGYTNVRH